MYLTHFSIDLLLVSEVSNCCVMTVLFMLLAMDKPVKELSVEEVADLLRTKGFADHVQPFLGKFSI